MALVWRLGKDVLGRQFALTDFSTLSCSSFGERYIKLAIMFSNDSSHLLAHVAHLCLFTHVAQFYGLATGNAQGTIATGSALRRHTLYMILHLKSNALALAVYNWPYILLLATTF